MEAQSVFYGALFLTCRHDKVKGLRNALGWWLSKQKWEGCRGGKGGCVSCIAVVYADGLASGRLPLAPSL